MTQDIKQWLKAMPKADLHCHLDGSLRLTTLFELAQKQKVQLPPSMEELSSDMQLGEVRAHLGAYLAAFALTQRVMQDRDSMARVVWELVEDVRAEGVTHLEIRFCPAFHLERGLSLSQVMDAVCQSALEAGKTLNVSVGVIVCAIRYFTLKQARELAEIAVQFKNRGVVGFDLAGDESKYPAKPFAELFKEIRSELFTTIHAGEGAGPASIWEALEARPNRIGHGVALIQDPVLIDVFARDQIPIESCVLSNWHTGSVKDIAEHPFKKLFESGVPMTLNTDNRLMSETNLVNELELVHRELHMNKHQLAQVVRNGFAAAFVPKHKKEELLWLFDHWLSRNAG